MAQNFPVDPNEAARTACADFLTGLPYLIPCVHCGWHFQKFLHNQSVPVACSSQSTLVGLLVEAHNDVSRVTHPCRAPFIIEDAARLYAAEDACFYNIVWADAALVRSNSTTMPTTSLPPTPLPRAPEGGCIVGGDPVDHAPAAIAPGTCTSAHTTKDPRLFGRHVWKALHLMAQNFPVDPNEAARTACADFLTGLPYLIPCVHCGWHFQKFLHNQSVPVACSSQSTLVGLLVEAHNDVSRVTHPCRAPFIIEDAARLYAAEDACFYNIVWAEDATLVRSN